MAIGAVLVDRARKVSRESTGRKVEGTTLMSPTHGGWFRARLFLNDAPERDESGERRKVVQTPQLMFALTDEQSEPVRLYAEDKVEVTSNELDAGTYRLTGDPQPIRKKRAVLGYLANLERVVERGQEGALG